MTSRHVAGLAIGAGLLAGAGVLLSVAADVAESSELGRSRTGTEYSVHGGIVSDVLTAKVDGQGKPVTRVVVLDPSNGELLSEDSSFIPLLRPDQPFRVAACVDGRWEMSPESGTATRTGAGFITVTRYTGRTVSLSAVSIPGIETGRSLC